MACAAGSPQQYPVRQTKTKTRNRYLNYFFITCGSHTYLHHRTGKDIWEGLYELPLIETEAPADVADTGIPGRCDELFRGTEQTVISVERRNVRHVLSHQILYATFYKAEIQKENTALGKYLKVPLSVLDEYPFPKLISAFLFREEAQSPMPTGE
jgi:A/G-specific adenine glycosylase